MPFIKSYCKVPECGKVAEVTSTFQIGNKKAHSLKCGHILIGDMIASNSPDSLISLDRKKPFSFQKTGIKFIEDSNARCLVADEMGLGKTIQALGFIALHPEKRPVAYIVKSSLKTQWQREIIRWIGVDQFPQIIDSSRDILLPGLQHYILSFDVLRRIKNLKEQFDFCGIQVLVIDECQHIKNSDSERAKQVRQLSVGIPHVIALSGTPIKNRADEYFTVLNILKPEMFPNFSYFQRNWCDSYWNGHAFKAAGLKNPQLFHRKTQDFIIRRTRDEVKSDVDLPQISRNFMFSELGAAVEEAYKATFKQFQDAYNSTDIAARANKIAEQGNIMAYLAKMRHLCGLSKIAPCVDYTLDFLESTDKKIVIFVHHKDVAEVLRLRLTEELKDTAYPHVINLEAGQGTIKVEEFKADSLARVMIASTLAAGEGLNMQFCDYCIMLERQWNPANEEQAEGRFIRIGQLSDKVTGVYMIAVGTIDEYLTEIIERKREIFANTMDKDGAAISWDQSSIMSELAEILSANGGKKWGW